MQSNQPYLRSLFVERCVFVAGIWARLVDHHIPTDLRLRTVTLFQTSQNVYVKEAKLKGGYTRSESENVC